MDEDSYLDSYMEDYISAGYANPWTYLEDPYQDDREDYALDPEWDEAEFERGFNEAHARSEEEGYDEGYVTYNE